jgi:hypothetical protein
MKKFFALTVVFAALFAAGCAEKDTMPPPADNEAAPADTAPAEEAPAEGATETP